MLGVKFILAKEAAVQKNGNEIKANPPPTPTPYSLPQVSSPRSSIATSSSITIQRHI